MGDEVLKKFGRYILLDRMAQGGMAEIFRSRLTSTEGAGRLLVIKRIQGGFGSNKEFLQMFKSETKVMMGFNHPNIVQVYDFGEEQNQPYIAMELVDGKNLRQYLNKLAKQNQRIPMEQVVWIMEQAASALGYAHAFKDKISGEPLNIVHRDVSPQNIMISYDGMVKVIDFGIAKAETNLENTRAGVIKGKPSYLSPEQIRGERLDGRSDIFALGVVMWELLTGKKLFSASGENEYAVLRQIESCDRHVRPPSEHNSNVPKNLDYILLKMLTKKREDRYQTAEELQRALHKFLYSHFEDFNPSDIALSLKKLFKDEIVYDRKRLQNLNSKVESLLTTEIPVPPHVEKTQLGKEIPKEDTTTMVDARTGFSSSSGSGNSVELSEESLSEKIEIDSKDSEISSRSVITPIRPAPVSAQTRTLPRSRREMMTQSHGTRTGVQSTRSSNSPIRTALSLALGVAIVSVVGPRFGIEVPVLSQLAQKFLPGVGNPSDPLLEESENPDQGRSIAQAESTPEKVEGQVKLKLNIFPLMSDAKVTLNQKRISARDPSVSVALNEPLELTVEQDGFQRLVREFVVSPSQVGDSREWKMDVRLLPLSYGYVTIYTTPSSDARIYPLEMKGRRLASQSAPWVLKTPLEKERIPAGTYRVELVNELLGMKKVVQIRVESGRSIKLSERLVVQ